MLARAPIWLPRPELRAGAALRAEGRAPGLGRFDLRSKLMLRQAQHEDETLVLALSVGGKD